MISPARRIGYGVLVVLLAVTVSPAWAIKVKEDHVLLAKPLPALTIEGKTVLADGGYYTFEVAIQPDFEEDWEVVTDTIKWTGPPGLSGTDGSTTASWQSPNNGNTYTVTAEGKLKRRQEAQAQEPGDLTDFDSKCKGDIYEPIMYWTQPTADSYVPEGSSTQVTVRVEHYVRETGEGFEWHDPFEDAVAINFKLKSSAGDVSEQKAHFDGGFLSTGGPIPSGCTSGGAVYTVTDQALGGEDYSVSAELLFCKTGFKLRPKTQQGLGQVEDSKKVVVAWVEVSTPLSTHDGRASELFVAHVRPPDAIPTACAWEWEWEAPEGAGNSPQTNFATPSEAETIALNARWFASPDNRLADVSGWDCTYTINCKVTMDGRIFRDTREPGWRTWRVWVAHPIAVTNTPWIVGFPELQQGNDAAWYVVGKGTLARRAPWVEVYLMPTTSQFYSKAVTVHEGRHMAQFTTGVPGLEQLAALWDADAFYASELEGLRLPTGVESYAINTIQGMINDKNKADGDIADSLETAAECDAFGVSNAEPPNYLEVDPQP